MRPYEDVFEYAANIKHQQVVLCDERELNFSLYHTLTNNSNLTLVEGDDPIKLMKAIKNEVETKNTYEAYLQDGIAEAEFYGWLFEALEKGETITEYQASQKLHSFREQRENFKGDSFTAILAYRDNAAMMHYAPKAEGSAVIKPEHFLLNDSGGQYFTGTTDTTRTFAMGELTDEERRDYTIVLKSVIAMSTAVFKEGMTGYGLDILCREGLWKYGLDYRCGTGHGVGYMLNVHEGPQSLGDRTTKLQPGMVLTIEPGIYTEGSHGIRTENTAVVAMGEKTEYGQFYHFETFTVVPIDTTPLKLEMMTNEENRVAQCFQPACIPDGCTTCQPKSRTVAEESNCSNQQIVLTPSFSVRPFRKRKGLTFSMEGQSGYGKRCAKINSKVAQMTIQCEL